MGTIHERLREERNRLGFSQENFAAIAGVTRRPYIAWEAGETAPTIIQISALAKVGLDVLYVITGELSDVALTPDERQLLSLFRAAPLTGKMAAVGALQGVLNSGTTIIATGNAKAAGRDINNYSTPRKKVRPKAKLAE